MASTPRKKRKNSSLVWRHARKFFRENGTVKHIKCNHCEKTFSYVGRSTANALNHLYRTHFNHLAPSEDSIDLKCEIVKKASVPEVNIDDNEHDNDIDHEEDNGVDDDKADDNNEENEDNTDNNSEEDDANEDRGDEEEDDEEEDDDIDYEEDNGADDDKADDNDEENEDDTDNDSEEDDANEDRGDEEEDDSEEDTKNRKRRREYDSDDENSNDESPLKKKRKLLTRREYRDKETRKRQREYENSDDSSSNEYKPLRKIRKVLRTKQYRDNNKKRQREYDSNDSSSNEYKALKKKRRVDSNDFKKGGKYVSQQKSLKELKDEFEALINYAKAQTQLNNQNVRDNQNVCNGRGLVLPPFDQSKYTNTSAQTRHNNRDSHYHTRHERQPTGQFTKRYPKPHKRVLGFT